MKKLKLLKLKVTWDAQVRAFQQIVTCVMSAKVLREGQEEWLNVNLWIRAHCLQTSVGVLQSVPWKMGLGSLAVSLFLTIASSLRAASCLTDHFN